MRGLVPAVFLLLLAILGLWSLQPGLAGSFLFDDFKNLDALGLYGRVHDARSLLLYLSSGNADPTGRPLSLLSFLLDADDWPADPAPFKRTNILLHLLNGLLLALLLLRLGRHRRLAESHAAAAGLLAALIWTVHPFWVSTVLYVVQRQAVLAATFSLLGLLLWTAGRQDFGRRRPAGVLRMLAGAWGCTLLAALSKGNGIVLPVLLWVTDGVLLQAPGERTRPPDRRLARLRLLCLKLPSLALGLWLGTVLYHQLIRPAPDGALSLGQRLLTEPRILVTYLDALWIPRSSAGRLFNDDYVVSTSALHPWTTLPALACLAVLIAGAIVWRRKYPIPAFCVLFYFAGHLIESSVWPLELYYEHRNYLPALPMFWPLAIWLTAPGPGLSRVRASLSGALPCLLAVLCHARAAVWGNSYELTLAFAGAAPDSARAQTVLGYYLLTHGRADLAVGQFRQTLSRHPQDAVAALHLIEAECSFAALPAGMESTVLTALRQSRNEEAIAYAWMADHAGFAASRACRGFDLDFLDRMLAALDANSHFSADALHRRDTEHLRGRLALARGDVTTALRDFDASLALNHYPGQALAQAALLGNSGRPDLALRHLDFYQSLPARPPPPSSGMPAIHEWLLRRTGYWTTQTQELKQRLRADVRGLPSGPAGTAAANPR